MKYNKIYCQMCEHGLHNAQRGKPEMGRFVPTDNYYCTDGRIPGAVKIADVWLLLKDLAKPVDRRYKKNYSVDYFRH